MLQRAMESLSEEVGKYKEAQENLWNRRRPPSMESCEDEAFGWVEDDAPVAGDLNVELDTDSASISEQAQVTSPRLLQRIESLVAITVAAEVETPEDDSDIDVDMEVATPPPPPTIVPAAPAAPAAKEKLEVAEV